MLQLGATGCYNGDALPHSIGALPTSPDPATPELQPVMAGYTPTAIFLLKLVVANSIAGGSKNLLRLQQNGVIVIAWVAAEIRSLKLFSMRL